jgi:hypothetical protein
MAVPVTSRWCVPAVVSTTLGVPAVAATTLGVLLVVATTSVANCAAGCEQMHSPSCGSEAWFFQNGVWATSVFRMVRPPCFIN